MVRSAATTVYNQQRQQFAISDRDPIPDLSALESDSQSQQKSLDEERLDEEVFSDINSISLEDDVNQPS